MASEIKIFRNWRKISFVTNDGDLLELDAIVSDSKICKNPDYNIYLKKNKSNKVYCSNICRHSHISKAISALRRK